MSIIANIKKVLGRRDEIEQKLSSVQIETEELTKLSRELAEIRPVAEQASYLHELMDNLEQARQILEDEGAHAELAEMARIEIDELSDKQEEAEL
ncbi:MAG: PCRF domain-containing protein, partial [Candidatus Puniceispirillaceae bacterium]